jgi:ribosomal-protein-alanine N-acetyltransferase
MKFQKGIHRIYANCDPDNQNSWGLLERMGFTQEGYLKKNVYFWRNNNNHPIWKDTFIYSKLNGKE